MLVRSVVRQMVLVTDVKRAFLLSQLLDLERLTTLHFALLPIDIATAVVCRLLLVPPLWLRFPRGLRPDADKSELVFSD